MRARTGLSLEVRRQKVIVVEMKTCHHCVLWTLIPAALLWSKEEIKGRMYGPPGAYPYLEMWGDNIE